MTRRRIMPVTMAFRRTRFISNATNAPTSTNAIRFINKLFFCRFGLNFIKTNPTMNNPEIFLQVADCDLFFLVKNVRNWYNY